MNGKVKIDNSKIKRIYKKLLRSLNRKKPYCSWSMKWDTAYFTGYESGLDKALEYLEQEFPELKSIDKRD